MGLGLSNQLIKRAVGVLQRHVGVVNTKPSRISAALCSARLGAMSCTCTFAASAQPSDEYRQVQRRLTQGWNTWNTQSVLSHVLLPEGFALNLGIKQNDWTHESYLREVLIGRRDAAAEQVRPGPHSYDGHYTELTLTWQKFEIRVQTAITGGDVVIL